MTLSLSVLLSASCLQDRGDPLWEIEVERGDTLKSIAAKYEVSERQIRRLNKLKNPNFLHLGKTLVIPRHTYLASDQTKPIWPVLGVVSSNFGKRGKRNHEGIDIASEKGRRIVAALQGTVSFVGYKKGYGKTVVIDHGGATSLYAHCSSIEVDKGRFVETGQVIARVGSTGRSTGPHVHFEWRMPNGRVIHPEYVISGKLPRL